MASDDKDPKKLARKYAQAIRNDERFSRFFKGYLPASVNSFIDIYTYKKAIWNINGAFYKSELEKMEMQWVNAAMDRLSEIQQVKLFLFQCRYRAGILEEPVKEVRTIFDFLYWQGNVLNALFLEPVTEEEIELYCEYMSAYDGNHNPMGFLESWQNYNNIKEAYSGEEDTGYTVPEWYSFYFSHTGRGIELMLPDIKGSIDISYFLKGDEERIRQIKEEDRIALEKGPATPAPAEGAYFNGTAEGVMGHFMNLFEDKKNREMYEVYESWSRFVEKEDVLRDDLDMLLYAEEDIPIKENESWVEALQLTAARYRTQKVAESLPAAYEQYKMNLSLGISYPEDEDSRSQSDFYNNLVLLGRKMLGEPEDFEY